MAKLITSEKAQKMREKRKQEAQRIALIRKRKLEERKAYKRLEESLRRLKKEDFITIDTLFKAFNEKLDTFNNTIILNRKIKKALIKKIKDKEKRKEKDIVINDLMDKVNLSIEEQVLEEFAELGIADDTHVIKRNDKFIYAPVRKEEVTIAKEYISIEDFDKIIKKYMKSYQSRIDLAKGITYTIQYEPILKENIDYKIKDGKYLYNPILKEEIAIEDFENTETKKQFLFPLRDRNYKVILRQVRKRPDVKFEIFEITDKFTPINLAKYFDNLALILVMFTINCDPYEKYEKEFLLPDADIRFKQSLLEITKYYTKNRKTLPKNIRTLFQSALIEYYKIYKQNLIFHKIPKINPELISRKDYIKTQFFEYKSKYKSKILDISNDLDIVLGAKKSDAFKKEPNIFIKRLIERKEKEEIEKDVKQLLCMQENSFYPSN